MQIPPDASAGRLHRWEVPGCQGGAEWHLACAVRWRRGSTDIYRLLPVAMVACRVGRWRPSAVRWRGRLSACAFGCGSGGPACTRRLLWPACPAAGTASAEPPAARHPRAPASPHPPPEAQSSGMTPTVMRCAPALPRASER